MRLINRFTLWRIPLGGPLSFKGQVPRKWNPHSLFLLLTLFLGFVQNAMADTTSFITKWKTTSAGESITIPINSSYTYDYDIDCDNDGIFDQFGVTVAGSCTYADVGEHIIKISGDFPAIYIADGTEKDKIFDVMQWGNIAWESMNSAFSGASNLQITATDSPDLSSVTNMDDMFYQASAFNSDISNWDVSNVGEMIGMFSEASAFNSDISKWDVSSVINMAGMFSGASAFNSDISNWVVSSVYNMNGMFFGASVFNSDISNWVVSSVTSMNVMFTRASAFNSDISNWDVSNVTNMGSMFSEASAFNSDISNWVVSSVTSMDGMFREASVFNSDISKWDVSNVTNMAIMFDRASAFNSDIKDWDVSSVTNMDDMFYQASAFNSDISNWDVSNVGEMIGMFSEASAFNSDISNWDVSSVTSMGGMFREASAFNSDLSKWVVSSVTSMDGMFNKASVFNSDISKWDVSSVTSMSFMFYQASAFNSDIKDWDVSNVTSMDSMFREASAFNSDLSKWVVSSVTSMDGMFNKASVFNSDIKDWDVSSVTSMSFMFREASVFNSDLSKWDVSSVTNMSQMFYQASVFNSDLSKWVVSSVTSMDYMFYQASVFNSDISNWVVSSVTSMNGMFRDITLSTANYDALLVGWDGLTLQPNVSFHGGNSQYTCGGSAAEIAHTNITSASGDNWTITDSGCALLPESFITISSPPVMTTDVMVGTSDHVLYRLNLAVTIADTILTGVTVTTNGTYQTSDIVANSFKLRYSTDAILDAGDAILKNLAVVAPSNNLVFDNLTQNIAQDTTGYLFVTADIATTATSGRTINISSIPLSNITFAAGVKSENPPIAAGSVQTIALPTASADLSITQTDSTDPVSTGAALSYTLNVNNAGPDPATSVEVTDTLPSGVVFGSATGTDWTCNEVTGTVTCTIASLSTGAANPITISVTAPGTAGSITNTATVSATAADPDTSNNSVSESTTVNTAPPLQADLSITQTDSTDPVFTGAALSYTLTVSNAGPDSATTVEVTDTLPSGVTFGSATGTDWTCNEATGTVTCTIASLSTGAANPITINVIAPGTAGSITNTATVSATTADPDTNNNSTSASTTVKAPPPPPPPPPKEADLSITQTVSSAPVQTGENFSYTLKVNNAGPNIARNLQVIDTLPDGVIFNSASGRNWTCQNSDRKVTCTLVHLLIGAANPITINVTAPNTAGNITNLVTVNSTTDDPETSNNSVRETTMVKRPPPPKADLSITQTDSRDPVETESNFSYILNVNNAGQDTANNVEVIDTLPSGVIFGSVSGTDWVCQESDGKITCTLAKLNVGAANPITINVSAPNTVGNITNTATISAETADPQANNNNTSENTAVVMPPSPPKADLSITKVDSADPDLTDDNSSYTLTVNNAGPDPAENVVITETLPSGVSLDSISGTDWICQEADNKITCTLASLNVGATSSLTINVVGATDTVASTTTVSATTDDPVITDNSVDASTPVEKPIVEKPIVEGPIVEKPIVEGPIVEGPIVEGPIVEGPTVEGPTVEGPIVEGPTVEGPIVEKPIVDILPSPEADLSITQTGPSESVWTGSNFSYTLSINNVGPDTANNVEVTDILPSDISFVSASGTDWICNESGGTLICTLTSLSIGKANPITVNVKAPNTAGDITNEVMLSSTTIDPEIDNNGTSEITVVETQPLVADLLISKFDSNDPVLVNGDLTYTLNVNNVGPDIASNITVTDTLPNGVIFGSVSGTNWKCQEAAPKVTCDIPKLDVGTANPITIKITAPAMSGNITNKATVTAMTLDPNVDNNSTEENTTVNPHQADLSITKIDSHDPVLTNSVFSYTLNVNNAGPEPANSVEVIDILPSTVTFNSASGTGWVCDESENTVVCELVGLNVGAANPIIINVTAPDTAGDIINTATVSATTLDPEEDNNSVSATMVVKALPLSPLEQSITLEVGDTVTVLNIKGGDGQRSVTEKPDSDIASFTYSDDDTLTLTGINRGITRLVISDSAEPPNTAILNITVRKLTCGNSHGMDKDGNAIETGACFTGTISVTSDDTCDNEPKCSRSGNHLTMIQSEDIGITANVDVDPQHIGAAAELLILAIQKHSDGTQVSYFRNAQGSWQLLENGDLSNIQATEKHEALPETVDINILPQGSISNLLFGEFIVYTGYRLEDGSIIYNGQEPLHFFVANSIAMDKEGKQLADPFAYFTNEVNIDLESDGEPIKFLLDNTLN